MKIEEVPNLVEEIQNHNDDWSVVVRFDAGREITDFSVAIDKDDELLTPWLAVRQHNPHYALNTLLDMAEYLPLDTNKE